MFEFFKNVIPMIHVYICDMWYMKYEIWYIICIYDIWYVYIYMIYICMVYIYKWLYIYTYIINTYTYIYIHIIKYIYIYTNIIVINDIYIYMCTSIDPSCWCQRNGSDSRNVRWTPSDGTSWTPWRERTKATFVQRGVEALLGGLYNCDQLWPFSSCQYL